MKEASRVYVKSCHWPAGRFGFVSLLLIGLALLNFGCQQMQYQPKQERTGGYSETQLATNIFDVHYNGNGWHDLERVSDFVTLRAAHLCLENGFDFFEEQRPTSQSPTVVNDPLLMGHLNVGTGGYARVVCHAKAAPKGKQYFESGFVVSAIENKYGL